MPKDTRFHALIRVAIRRSIRIADWDVGLEHIQNSYAKHIENFPRLNFQADRDFALKLYWRFIAIFGPRWTTKMGYPYTFRGSE